jgi:von Willebrand factor type A domain
MSKMIDTTKLMSAAFCAAMSVGLLACGGGPSAGPCEKTPPDPTCSLTCSPGDSTSCPSGFHCATDAKCYAFCTQGGGECGSGLTCTDDGRCVPSGADAGPQPDGKDCPAVNFTAMPVTPSIQLVLDRSGSMINNDLGSVTRWDAMTNALINATTGVVVQLQAKAYFGATIYPGGSAASGVCNQFSQTPRALNGAAAITQALQQRPAGTEPTPTGPAVQSATAAFAAMPAPANSPKIIVLATDGDPNGCNGENFDQGQAASVAAATAAHAAGIDLYVLSVDDGANQDNLKAVANAGRGVNDATVFLATNPAQLKAAFDTIIGGVVSCQLNLSGSIDVGQAANGTVVLNGRALMFGTEWRAVDADTIELVGAACTELKNTASPTVNASFPCGVVVE